MDEKSKRSTLDELCAEPAYQFLVSTLVNGSCILVGAGSSVRAGMPGWGKLLDELDAAAIAAGKPVDVATPHALLRAGAYENALGRDGVGRVIAKVFGRPERAVLHTTFHSQLVSLPSRALLTTNYDLVLESAVSACGQPPLSFDWSDSDARSRFANALVDRPLVTPVVHLHGSVRSPSDVVLGLDSYDRMYERDNASKMALATLVTVSRLVFIGFSFDDETFGELLKRVRALHDPKQTKHVAILPSKGQEEDKRRSEELRGLYRVQPLFYDASNNRVQLDQLIDRLVTDVQARVAADQEIVRRTIIASLNVPPEDQLRLMRESGSDSSRSSGIGQIAQPKSLVTGGPRVALDDEIDVIAKLMRSGKPAKAIEEFTRLEHDHAAEIDDRLRYRVRANTGHAWLEVGDDQKAAACYAVAGDLRPNDRDGGWLRCLAKELCGQIADAAACADVVVREFPDCDNAWAVWVRTHSETLTPREIRRQVPRKLRRDADVAATISTVYRASGDWRGAIAYGRATLRGAPDRPRAQSHLAVALLECAARCSTFRMPRGLVPKDEGPIHEAIGLLDNAISELLKGEPTRFLGVCLVNRAAAFRLLGEQDKADVDISEAFRLVPADPIVLGKYISLLDRRKESDRIIQLLTSPAAIEVAQEAKFFLAIAYLRRHVVGDGEMAIATLQNLVATAPADLIGYSDALGLLIDRLLASGRSKDALDQLRAVPAGRISSALLNARIATVEATEDGKLTPTDATRQAIRKSGVEAMAGEPIDRVEIAQRAAEIGEYQTAADLLLTVVDPIQLNQTTSLLLECLHHANRDMALIEACRSLRKAGVESRSVLAYEVNTLVSNGEDFAAMDLLRGWLSRHGDDRKALLEFGRLALRTGRQSEACFDVSRLPTVAEVDSEEMGSGITEYLRAGNRQADARRYAYDLYRRFPGSEVIRLALIWSDMNFKVDGDAERPKKVDDNTAFTLALQPTGTLQDVFVGDAIVLADELLPSDPLVAAAWGHVAGDEIAVGDRIYTLVRADDKIRRRAVDCLASFTQRFPTTDRLVEYSVPEQPADVDDPRQVLGPMYDVLAQEDQHRQRSLAVYSTGKAPLAFIAKRLGRSVLSMMSHLASLQTARILANAARDDKRAAAAFERVRSAVLDDTAIGTLYLLDLDTALRDLPMKFVVPTSTLLPLRQLVQELRQPHGRQGRIGLQEGRFYFTEFSIEEEARQADRLDRFLNNIESICEMVGGLARQNMPTELRDALIQTTTPGVVDAVAIALDRSIPLWTDDDALVDLCLTRAGVLRVWTQRVLVSSRATESVYVDAVRKLVQFNFEFVRVRISDVIASMHDADWQPRSPKLQRMLAYVGRHGTANSSNALLTRTLLLDIWTQCPRGQRRAVALALIRALPREHAKRFVVRPLFKRWSPSDRRSRSRYTGLRHTLRNWMGSVRK